MGLEQFLTEEDKVKSLEQIQQLMYGQLFSMCVRAGIDPEDFDYKTWEAPEITPDNMQLRSLHNSIKHACDSLKVIDSKLG